MQRQLLKEDGLDTIEGVRAAAEIFDAGYLEKFNTHLRVCDELETNIRKSLSDAITFWTLHKGRMGGYGGLKMFMEHILRDLGSLQTEHLLRDCTARNLDNR